MGEAMLASEEMGGSGIGDPPNVISDRTIVHSGLAIHKTDLQNTIGW